ncbi:MAG: hypothetical protein HYT80_01210 [Euryarchaeota archaeon]|nr:hypothetical protein [Euryarchaeota archaeon]
MSRRLVVFVVIASSVTGCVRTADQADPGQPPGFQALEEASEFRYAQPSSNGTGLRVPVRVREDLEAFGKVHYDRWNDTTINIFAVNATNPRQFVTLIAQDYVADRYAERYQNKTSGENRGRCLEAGVFPPCPPEVTFIGATDQQIPPVRTAGQPNLARGDWYLYVLLHHPQNLMIELTFSKPVLIASVQPVEFFFESFSADAYEAGFQDIRLSSGAGFTGRIVGGNRSFTSTALDYSFYIALAVAWQHSTVSGCLVRFAGPQEECMTKSVPGYGLPVRVGPLYQYPEFKNVATLTTSVNRFQSVKLDAEAIHGDSIGFTWRVVHWDFS